MYHTVIFLKNYNSNQQSRLSPVKLQIHTTLARAKHLSHVNQKVSKAKCIVWHPFSSEALTGSTDDSSS